MVRETNAALWTIHMTGYVDLTPFAGPYVIYGGQQNIEIYRPLFNIKEKEKIPNNYLSS